MNTFKQLLLCLLIAFSANCTLSAKPVKTVPSNGVLCFLSLQEEDPEFNERMKHFKETKRMHWRSLAALIICGVSIAFLWKETEKRGKRTSFYLAYIPTVLVLVNSCLFFNFFRWFFPVAFYVALTYPLLYLDWSEGRQKAISIIGTILVGICCIRYNATVNDWRDVLLVISKPFVYFCLNVPLFIAYRFVLTGDRCPHCHYFADHKILSREQVDEDLTLQQRDYVTKDGDRISYDGKTRTLIFSEHSEYTLYRNKYYETTKQCARCGKTWHYSGHRREKVAQHTT